MDMSFDLSTIMSHSYAAIRAASYLKSTRGKAFLDWRKSNETQNPHPSRCKRSDSR